jgi:hypothetical protein
MNYKQQKQYPPRGIMENTLFHIVRALYIIFAVSRACVYKTYRFFVPVIAAPLPKPPPNYEENYKKYIHIYATPEKNPDANVNIDTNLYDYEKRKEIFKEEKNDCEEHWKRKLMYEYTPRGNVIVYYNPYKHAFMYYSDENSIPYNIMQYVAKKYAVMFRCRDFFIDPDTFPNNPILEVMKKEEEALKVKSKKVNDITKLIDKDLNMNNKDIFATLKDYKHATDKHATDKHATDKHATDKHATDKPLTNKLISNKFASGSNEAKEPIKNKFSNTFVRLGKTREFNIIQKPPDKNIAIVNSILFGENNIGKTMDFFDSLEITDTVVENPFSKLDCGNQEKTHNIDLQAIKTPPLGDDNLIKFGIEDEDKSVVDEDLSKVKSWKDFKNLKKR